MDHGLANARLHTVTVWRNLLLIGLGLSLSVNIMLSVFVLSKRHSVVLLPTIRSGGAYEIGDRINRAYLEDTARTIIHTLLNVTPGVRENVLESLLAQTHPSFYGEFRRYFSDWMEEVKSRNIATAFYPLSIRSDPATLQVTIKGILRSYIGSQKVDEERVTYLMTFDYTGTRLTLARLTEEREAAQ